MPKVAVLRDFSYAERPGEAELAADRFLKAKPEGIELIICPPENEVTRDVDAVISFGLKRYDASTLEWLASGEIPHLFVADDWWDGLQPKAEFRNGVVEAARAACFFSPLHQQRYMTLHRIEDKPNQWLIPFPVMEQDYFMPEGVEPLVSDPNVWVWSASWHPDNGNDLLGQWCDRTEQVVHCYGLGVPTGGENKSISFRGGIALEGAFTTLGMYKKFLATPRVPQPFGFTFLVAYMLGLQCTWMGEIGCLSYGQPEKFIDSCHDAPSRFWDKIMPQVLS